MMMDAVKIGTLPTTKPLLSNKIYESTDISKGKIDDILFPEDIEDEEMRLRLSDEEEIEQENISSNVQNLQLKIDGAHISTSKLIQLARITPAISRFFLIPDSTNASATINSEKISEVCQKELKSTDSSADLVDNSASVIPEQKAKVCQEKLKDSDTSVNQEDTPASAKVEETSESCQQESKDLDESVAQLDHSESAIPEETSEVLEQESKDSSESDEQDNLSNNGDLDEEGVNENGDLSDEESREESMNDKMSHNPTKYWSSFNPRPWKGSRKRPGFPRGSNSWYHQQYPDRDKLKKNNLHHSTSHFIRTNRSRGGFSSTVRDSWTRSESLRLKDKKSSKDVNSGKDNSVKQNGVGNGLDHKENTSSSQNDKLITVMNKADKVKSKELISTVQSKRVSDNAKMTGNDGGVKLVNGVVYLDSERINTVPSTSITKNCDLSMTEFDKGKSSSKSTTESMKTPKISEILSEAQIQIKDVTSQNNGMDNKFKDAMDVDENVNDKPDSTSDLICIQTNVRDSSEKTGKNDDFNCITIVQEKTNGTLENNKKSGDGVQRNECQTLDNGKSMTFTEGNGVKNYQSMDVDISTESSQMLNNEDDWRDSEFGSLVIDESALTKENKTANDKSNAEPRETDDGKTSKDVEKSGATKNKDQNGLNNVIEEVDLIDDDSQEAILKSNNVDGNASVPIDTTNGDKVEESNQDGRAAVHKRRRRKKVAETMQEELLASESENGGRQKRRSARNAEEMIRKEILKGDNDEDDSGDDSDKLVSVNYRNSSTPNIVTRTLSPPTLKRTLDDLSDEKDNAVSMALKRIRTNAEDSSMTIDQRKSKESVPASGQLMRKVAQEDIRGKLKKMTHEELESLLLQKVAECITARGEVGKLREQARASKKTQESLRNKCTQLQKQVEGFEMVLRRINYDKNSNGDKYVPPIKINRSVGLQVNFLSKRTFNGSITLNARNAILQQDHGIQNLKQIQNIHSGPNNSANSPKQMSTTAIATDNSSPRKMMKTRSPRRPDMTPTTIVQVPSASSIPAQANNSSPALVMTAKTIDANAKRNGNLLQLVSTSGNQQQTVTTRPTLTIQRTTAATASKSNDLIDLTDEEDKSKVSTVATIGGLPARLPRVLQAVPASSVAALGNATNLRLVPAANSQAAMGTNAPRLAYVMQSGPNGVPTRQLVLTSNNTMKTVTSVTTTGTLNYKRGVTALPNGAVRLVTTQPATMQISKHPAPLPETPMPPSDSSWKLAPPAPSLKISKVATGIVLSWNMSLTDKYADIVSYQLYAYQEVAGTPPSATLWKKVGDVRALPLPMACTLTQFTEGNNYYFAVRAVDAHSRFGQYSKPGNISL